MGSQVDDFMITLNYVLICCSPHHSKVSLSCSKACERKTIHVSLYLREKCMMSSAEIPLSHQQDRDQKVGK